MASANRPVKTFAGIMLLGCAALGWIGVNTLVFLQSSRTLSRQASSQPGVAGETPEDLDRIALREAAFQRRLALGNALAVLVAFPALLLLGFRGWRALIRWQNFILRGMTTGLTGRKQAEDSLLKIRQMEQYLAGLSSRLMQDSSGGMDEEVHAALQASAEMVEADRSYLFQVSEDRATYTNSHEYCRSGVKPFRDELQDIPWGSFPFFEKVIQKPRDFIFESLDRLPPEASSEKAEYEKEGIQSLAIVPLVVKGEVRGWLGFDVIRQTRMWKSEEISLLKMLGGLLIDAMDRDRYLAKIEEQAEWLDQAADAILLLDLEGKVLYGNKASRGLFSGDGGLPAAAPLAEDKVFAEALARTREAGRWSGEWRRKNASGPDSIFRSRWSLVRGPDGEVRGVLTLHTDVSEAKKMEEQMLRSQRMESIGTLAGGIAHDLNNILAPLLMAVPLLRRSLLDPALDPILDMLAGNVKRGSDLVKQVLGFSRGHAGEKLPVNLAPLVTELEKFILSSFPKDIEVRTLLTDSWNVRADPTQVHQVLLNLCVNARDAMPKGGIIAVGLENTAVPGKEEAARLSPDAAPGRWVALTVEDNGEGIPPEIMDRIFDPFFTTKAPGKGTGIGLATVAGIMKSHGGFLTVHSAPGKGSVFRLYFPATDQSAGAGGGGERRPPPGRGETVLVVDDELSLREINRATLTAYGYRVTTAADGSEAASLFAERKGGFDLVIMDMNMPVMDGPQTIRALRRIDPKVRVLGSSGDAADEKTLDVLGFLPKPYGAEKLLWAVHEAIREGGARRAARLPAKS